MMDWLVAHGGVLVLVMFFVMFLSFAYWAFQPKNKDRMNEYGQIPLREKNDGQ